MPATMALTDLLALDEIHIRFRAASVIDAIPQLLGATLARRGLSPAVGQQIIDAVIRRERETATACGALVLPHARSAAVSEFVFSLGTNPAGVIAGQAEPRLIFIFVSPEGKREQHLQVLAALARLAQNRESVDRIAGAATADQVMDALRVAA